MCRILGFWDQNFKGDYDIDDVLRRMSNTLKHGGPDDIGFYVDYKSGLGLGHRRLAILDLSLAGHQPMTDEDNRYVIVYNGEIYNYLDIKKELEFKYNIHFKSVCDTEVIIYAFKLWGINSLEKFRGMFAFAIYDTFRKELFLVRDRIGIKPLYWYYKDGLFMFASELKSFHRHPKFNRELNIQSLSLYLQYGYITSPYSIFENTYKLEPGHYLFIDKNGRIKKIVIGK